MSSRQSAPFLLTSICVRGAGSFDGAQLERATTQAYLDLTRRLRDGGDWKAVRAWNQVPNILGDGGHALDRYMCFNAGRYRALTEWFGGDTGFDRVLPAASAVGHDGPDLWVHLLSTRGPARAITNPRQRAPHRYSRRFGPVPPCFSRAMLIEAEPARQLLMIGGTASIRGEDSVHPGDLSAQLQETIENLTAVAGEAFGDRGPSVLDRFTDLRIFHPRAADRPAIEPAISAQFTSVRRIEWMQAGLCRRDLLVEIEALAVREN